MLKPTTCFLAILLAYPPSFAQTTPASQGETVLSEQGKLIRAPQALGVLGADLFGDKVNFYNGSLEFVQTDVSLPGNNSLPVAVGRRLVVGDANPSNHEFMQWMLDIPRIHGTFSQQYGWTGVDASGNATALRCTNFGKPHDVAYQVDIFRWFEYWHGNSLYVPGVGDQEILKRNPQYPNVPADNQATPLLTKGNWAVRCLPSLASTDATTPANEAGEGFLVIGPDGTQYRFDWLVARPAPTVSKPSNSLGTSSSPEGVVFVPTGDANAALPDGFPPVWQASGTGTTTTTIPIDSLAASISQPIPDADPTGIGRAYVSVFRHMVSIYPTLITDRFGNTVRYVFDPANKRRLQRIEASDGRVLTFAYQSGTDFISSVTDGTRTWTYTYAPAESGRTVLGSVTLPDQSRWQLAGMEGPLETEFRSGMYAMRLTYPAQDTQPSTNCLDAPPNVGGPLAIGSMVHPSGAIGTFTMTPTEHGRNLVPAGCYGNGSPSGAPVYPAYTDSYSLTEKTITGPGLPTLTWRNNYDGTYVPGWKLPPYYTEPAIVLSTDPNGDVTRYTFGATYGVNEGLLLQTDYGWNGSTALKTTKVDYERSFANPVGFSDQIRGDNWVTTHLLPQNQRVTTQQGATFTWQASDFDSFARPRSVTKSSSLGFGRTENTRYFDLLNKWILGQTESVTETSTGGVMMSHTYDPNNGNLLSTSRFGVLAKRYDYFADGTLQSATDGLNQTTRFSNYKRGLAQNISYADGKGESAVVNDIGFVTSTTDANGFTTNYGYDNGWRLSRISYPTGDSVAWNDTTITTEPVTTAEYGLPAGHWRQTVATGNARSISYLDALWRPVLTRNFDLEQEAATRKMRLMRYDFRGKTIFTSKAERNITSLTQSLLGTRTSYDALARPTQIVQDSELGPLTTRFDYLPGFQKRTTNPRNFAMTASYQAFDEPMEDALIGMSEPEGVTLTILRDVFGKPTSISKSGLDNGNPISATRRYVYDATERLCKTIEPETGATIEAWDNANNTVWRASGLSLTNSNTCDLASVPDANKVSYSYDARNRLISTRYGDGSPGITRSYTPDGLPDTITSDGLSWSTRYNRRRLPEQESLPINGVTYTLGRSYNANGHLNTLSYPYNLVLDYAPNAIGEATRVGSFARNIQYHPSGAIAGFIYGNGLPHTMNQNVRELPESARDVNVSSDIFTYDANANLVGITDRQENIATRSMSYDGLDRLTGSYAPSLWGQASYSYDVLDNLRTSQIAGRSNIHSYDLSGTNRLLSINNNGNLINYRYDNQGNITLRGSQAFRFDLANRISSATGKATYHYDGLGHRSKIDFADGSTRLQIYSPAGQLLFATQTASSTGPASRSWYIYLHHGLIAEVKQ